MKLVLNVLYLLFVFFFFIRELILIVKLRLAYFKQFWSYAELLIVGLSKAAAAMYAYKYFYIPHAFFARLVQQDLVIVRFDLLLLLLEISCSDI